ncbi:MAG TPA: hypothetical protein VL595_24925 [Pseudonocardia sp.]|nr:hypothetical protein [Pseudonocardia sp.]
MTAPADPINGSAPMLHVPDNEDRDDLGAFTARVVRLDPGAFVRLRAGGGRVVAWAMTPFDVLATRAVPGELRPADLTVSANELLAALAVVRGDQVEPGRPEDSNWRAELPSTEGWRAVDEVPAAEIEALAEQGIALAREHGVQHGDHQATTPPAGLLDQTVLTATGEGMRVQVPLRCLFALSGMGFIGGGAPDDRVRISANDSWLRLDARFGAVVRRRRSLLPLLF